MLKGGEEVRIDQRVQQLFGVMNGLLRRSPRATAANLQVTSNEISTADQTTSPLPMQHGQSEGIMGVRPADCLLRCGSCWVCSVESTAAEEYLCLWPCRYADVSAAAESNNPTARCAIHKLSPCRW